MHYHKVTPKMCNSTVLKHHDVEDILTYSHTHLTLYYLEKVLNASGVSHYSPQVKGKATVAGEPTLMAPRQSKSHNVFDFFFFKKIGQINKIVEGQQETNVTM